MRAFIATLALICLSPGAFATCQPTAQSLIDQCRNIGKGAAANAGAISGAIGAANTANTVAPGASALQSAADQTANQGAGAVTGCGSIYDRCAQITCTPDTETAAEKQKCTSGIQGLANQIATETAQAKQTGLGAAKTKDSALGSLGTGLAGAAVGGIAGYMIGKSTANDGASAAATTTSATALDCTSADAYRYSDCDQTFISACYGMATTAACQAFTARYCASAVTAGSSVALSSSLYETVDATGGGLATNFCRYASAQSFCQTSGRASCPSCLGLTSYASCAPTATTSCLTTNTQALTVNAQTICPTDPVFADPTTSAAIAAAVTGSGTTTAANTTLTTASVSGGDVSTEYGPTLFSITSTVLADRCAKNQLNCN